MRVSLILGVLLAAVPHALAAQQLPLAALDVWAVQHATEETSCGPPPLQIDVKTDLLVLSEPRRLRAAVANARAMVPILDRLRAERPERVHAILRVNDGVTVEQLVEVVDVLVGHVFVVVEVELNGPNQPPRKPGWARIRS